jgi:hypothetical protein
MEFNLLPKEKLGEKRGNERSSSVPQQLMMAMAVASEVRRRLASGTTESLSQQVVWGQ